MDSARPSPWLPDLVYGFFDGEEQAQALARALGVAYARVNVHQFPDQECKVRVSQSALHPVLYRSLHTPNGKLIEIVLAAGAMRDNGASDIALVAPYLAYMRQDIAFNPGEAVSQKIIGKMLCGVFDRFLSVDPHLHRTPTLGTVFGGKPALALTAAPLFITHLKDRGIPADTLILGPDIESQPMTAAIADALGLHWTVASKERSGDRAVHIVLPPGLNLAGRHVVLVDDVISSGTTICTIASSLKYGGAQHIDVYTTHALFDDKAEISMTASGVNNIYSSDSIPHASNALSLTSILLEGLNKWR